MPGEWIEAKARGIYARFFAGEWSELGDGTLQGECPAAHRHTGRSARTDARVHLKYGANGETPGCYCLHTSCGGELAKMNEDFREELFRKDGSRPKTTTDAGVVKCAPRPKGAGVPQYNEAKLRGLVRSVPEVGAEWFEERSPVDPRGLRPGDFLERVFDPGQRVMVFADYFSQGDFLWEVGKGGYRLAKTEGVRAVRSELPTDGGKDGVWFLSNPVDGRWHPNPRREGRRSRRSEESVTQWRHVVLESDVAAGELWLRFLAMAPLAIVAIYSSGGRSWHALVRVDQPDKPSFDTLLRDSLKKSLPVIGADAGALTPVRLTRLPGCTRGGRLQRCIYLNPKADPDAPDPITNLKPLR
jgi:hypothetical protein